MRNKKLLWIIPGLALLAAITLGTASKRPYGVMFKEMAAPDTPQSGWGMLYFDTSGVLKSLNDEGTSVSLAAGSGDNTLDNAYDQGGAGAGKAITVDTGAVALSNTDADTAYLLSLNASPSSSAALGGMTVTMGANSTQDAVSFANSGSGKDIDGTGSLWYAQADGTGFFTSLSATTMYMSTISAAASGNANATYDAAGTGTITIAGTSTGLVSFPGTAVDIGDSAADTLTITSVIDGDVTLDDGVTASPSLIMKDATDETATFSKTDAGYLTVTTVAGDGVQILTGNLKIGNGTPGQTINGEDLYVEGISEFDGAMTVDGAMTFNNDITLYDGTASSISKAANGAADDFTISLTGAQNASLVLASAGVAADAVQVTASAGGVDISSAATYDIDITATGGKILGVASEAAADQFKIDAQGTVAGNAINLETTDGGIILNADGADNGDIDIDAADDLDLIAAGAIAIDSADWDISATGAATNMASIGFDSATVIYHDTVELSNADIKALNGTPKQLVAAPGANFFLEFVSAVLILDYGTNVLTESADNLVIEYITSGADVTAAIEMTGFIDQAVDQMAFVNPAGIATDAASDIVNNGLQLTNTGDGEFAGNAGADTTMTVKIAYRIHADGL